MSEVSSSFGSGSVDPLDVDSVATYPGGGVEGGRGVDSVATYPGGGVEGGRGFGLGLVVGCNLPLGIALEGVTVGFMAVAQVYGRA
jgi:hypothetical protein